MPVSFIVVIIAFMRVVAFMMTIITVAVSTFVMVVCPYPGT